MFERTEADVLDTVRPPATLALLTLNNDSLCSRITELFAHIQAATYERLASLDPEDFQSTDDSKSAVETMGRPLQQQAARRSGMLKQPIKDLARNSEDGGPVANALVDLKEKVEDLDPNRFDFSAGWASRMLGIIPGGGGTQRLPRIVGYQKAKEMNFSGRHVGAEEALQIGLADKVVAADELVDFPKRHPSREIFIEISGLTNRFSE